MVSSKRQSAADSSQFVNKTCFRSLYARRATTVLQFHVVGVGPDPVVSPVLWRDVVGCPVYIFLTPSVTRSTAKQSAVNVRPSLAPHKPLIRERGRDSERERERVKESMCVRARVCVCVSVCVCVRARACVCACVRVSNGFSGPG